MRIVRDYFKNGSAALMIIDRPSRLSLMALPNVTVRSHERSYISGACTYFADVAVNIFDVRVLRVAR